MPDIALINANSQPFKHDNDLMSVDMVWDAEAMLMDKSVLIDQAADVFQAQLDRVLGGDFVIERINLEKISVTKSKEGHMEDGELTWGLTIRNPNYKTIKQITVSNVVRAGKINDALYMTDGQGVIMPFTRPAVANFINLNIK